MKQKSLFLSLIALLLSCSTLLAQTRSLSGTVKDEAGEGAPGVTVQVKGTNIGTYTDVGGAFRLNGPAQGTLVFSLAGYTTKEMPYTDGTSSFEVSLSQGESQLNEVVVTAFGISKDQKTLSYATQPIQTKTFAQARELNVANSLAGRVAGLDIARSSSGVGGSTRVVLRGDRSITGNNQALIVVDGVPMDNSNFSPGNANGGRESGGDGLSSINPDDIDNINVLRGAAATALYGSRAANGALLITTKKGSARKGIGVSVNSSFLAESAIVLQDFQDEFGQGSGGVYNRASEFSWGPRMTGQSVAAWGPSPSAVGATYNMSPQVGSYGDFYGTGTQLSNSLTLTGGTDKMQTYFSYTNVNATGIVDNNKLRRHNFNLRLNNQLSSKLTMDTKITYLKEEVDNRQQTGEAFANLQRHILRLPRNIPLAQAEQFEYVDPVSGNLRQNFWNPGSNGGQNPYWIKNRVTAEDTRDRVLGFSSLTYQFTPAFSVMARAGLDQYVDRFEGKWFTNTYTIADNGEYQTSWRNVQELNLDLLAFYKKQLGENLTLDVTAGAGIQRRNLLEQSTLNNGLNRPNLFITGNARNSVTTRNVDEREKQGVFATADLTFKNALTISLWGRNDWSSTLPSTSWSYFFPGGGFSWLISESVAMPKFVSFAKLRGSYAETGNDARPYLLQQTYTFLAGGPNGFISRDPTKPFPTLNPELTTALEVGLEVRFFNNRLGFDIGAYSSDSKNQLFQVAIPPASGWSSEFINAGLVRNEGLEIVLNGNPVRSGKFRWDVDLNWAANRNELVELTPEQKSLNLTSDFMNNIRAIEGKPLGEIFSRGYVRNANGQVVVGADGLPQITPGTTVYLGNSRPDWTGGLNNRLSFGNLSLSFLISARMGGVVTSFTNAVIYADGTTKQTLEGRDAYVFPGVREDGSANTITTTAERYWLKVGGRNTPAGEVFTYSASNIRLREAVLSYSVPSKVLGSKIQAASISMVGRNLFFLLNNAEGFDPELAAGTQNTTVGLESFSLPSTRSIGVNINLTF
jgi:TonB-linked SusC/RagA family outer membrane protein